MNNSFKCLIIKFRLKLHCIVKMVEFFQSYAYNIYGWVRQFGAYNIVGGIPT